MNSPGHQPVSTWIGEFIALAALWGASFLFMRLGAAEFGPVTLSALRVGLATLVLLPLLFWRGQAVDRLPHVDRLGADERLHRRRQDHRGACSRASTTSSTRCAAAPIRVTRTSSPSTTSTPPSTRVDRED